MQQDYRELSLDELESVEKQTLRTIVQALQQYSKEAKVIFETTEADSSGEVIVLAEDITQYALEVAETYPINRRFAGFIDYKRVRWLPSTHGLLPQVLLVDAKASTEKNRDTLQRSQLPMDAEFRNSSSGEVVTMEAGVIPHLLLQSANNGSLPAVTTSIFVHFYYKDLEGVEGRYRELKSIYVLSLPHSRLKQRYNPDPETSFFGAGKHSPARGEVARIRVYFDRLKEACPWRLQELHYSADSEYTTPCWREADENGNEVTKEFLFLER
ncbi:SfiI family type II restriction endonuclease [Streptomyces globisporus]|uniref:SfiI family type II restriction endonuclease n=1 Tax=Streptomyces TaxID=1883 RepID=UPI001F421B53|nr:SfiI family type II restriction endonuclease [Streptomyces sp. R527F]UIZ14193.1 SfiI family type II restriction endonuclease [Streptomyces sp. R527F]